MDTPTTAGLGWGPEARREEEGETGREAPADSTPSYCSPSPTEWFEYKMFPAGSFMFTPLVSSCGLAFGGAYKSGLATGGKLVDLLAQPSFRSTLLPVGRSNVPNYS